MSERFQSTVPLDNHGLGAASELMLGCPEQERSMAHAASNERDASLERRVGELELKMHEAHLRATSAWDAHVRDVQKKHDFWWAAFRYFAVAQLGFAIGVLFFGRR